MHNILLAHRSADAQLVFLGDSITQRWEYRPQLWAKLAPYHPANLGCGGDTVANVLWRVQHGALDGIQPRVIVLMAGTNDLTGEDEPFYKHANPTTEEIAEGDSVLLREIRIKQPQATIILTAVLPRIHRVALVRDLNARLARFAGDHVVFIDFGDQLLAPSGEIDSRFTTDGLHLTDAGYEIWLNSLMPALRKIFTE